ncbi:WD40-repeat-containing domain protein [Aspergillus granulosus]|uniref:Nuclear distribution protein nudF n=1 Tax=Aspergillus granulosus TaxID=176169 RepID=A0ABR4HB52_9EURO
MSQILTAGQAGELHKSMVAYLSSIGATQSSTTLREELEIGDGFDETTRKKYEGLLEKKWTGIARLQRKILDLEARLASLQAELDSTPSAARAKQNKNPENWLPGSLSTYTLESHRDAITCIAFHPVFTSVASGSEDCTIKIWDWELGELEQTLKGHTRAVSGLDFGGQKGQTLLASCSGDLTIKIWDPSKDYANTRTLHGHDHSVSAVHFLTPTSNLLVSASRDASLRVWDVTTGFCVKTIQANDWLRTVSPSIDGKWLVSGGRDQAVTVWDASTAEPKAALLGHENDIQCCVFAPPSSYKYMATLAGHKAPPPADSTAEFIATGSRDKTIKLWESRGRLIKTLTGHDNWVRGLVFHPGGKYLISVSDDKTMRCWDLSQEARCVKTVDSAHERFVTCIRWAPLPNNEAAAASETNGSVAKTPAKPTFQCAIATGSADSCVRVFK